MDGAPVENVHQLHGEVGRNRLRVREHLVSHHAHDLRSQNRWSLAEQRPTAVRLVVTGRR